MADHPSTYDSTPVESGEHAWQDRAALHAKNDGDGVLDGAKALRRGTFAELIRHLAMLPEEERNTYVIEKAGDREYSAEEAVALAKHPSFPKS